MDIDMAIFLKPAVNQSVTVDICYTVLYRNKTTNIQSGAKRVQLLPHCFLRSYFIAVLIWRRQTDIQTGVIPTFAFLCTSWSTPNGAGAPSVVVVVAMLICNVEERRIRLSKGQQMLNRRLTSFHMQI